MKSKQVGLTMVSTLIVIIIIIVGNKTITSCHCNDTIDQYTYSNINLSFEGVTMNNTNIQYIKNNNIITLIFERKLFAAEKTMPIIFINPLPKELSPPTKLYFTIHVMNINPRAATMTIDKDGYIVIYGNTELELFRKNKDVGILPSTIAYPLLFKNSI